MRMVLLLVCMLLANKVAALELGTGLAAVEEGDDRQRPALAFHLGIGKHSQSRAYSFGRKHGPFIERTVIVSSSYRFSTFKQTPNLYANVGGGVVMEQTRERGAEHDGERRQYNLGPVFGLAYVAPWRSVYFSAHWDAHLFLVGSASLLLTTARKQKLGLTMGWKIP